MLDALEYVEEQPAVLYSQHALPCPKLFCLAVAMS